MNKIVSLFLLLITCATSTMATDPLVNWPTQYSANMTTTAGGIKADVKIYVDGDKTRSDVTANGMKVNSIIRKDRKLMYSIIPAQKAYMVMPLTDQLLKADSNPMKEVHDGKAKVESMGTESIKGELCDKYKISNKTNTSSEAMLLWMSKSKKIPVRMASEDGQTVIEWSDFKLGAPGADLFEPPSDYEKMEMPSGFSLPGNI